MAYTAAKVAGKCLEAQECGHLGEFFDSCPQQEPFPQIPQRQFKNRKLIFTPISNFLLQIYQNVR
jgi:hypothetical protein